MRQRLNFIYGLAFDASGNLYASTYANSTITKLDPEGDSIQFATGLGGPYGLAFGSSGALYAANYANNTLSEISPSGVVSPFASGLDEPVSIAIQTPEPSSIFLFCLCGLGLLQRRRCSSSAASVRSR